MDVPGERHVVGLVERNQLLGSLWEMAAGGQQALLFGADPEGGTMGS